MHVSNVTQQGGSRADVGIPIWLVPESLLLEMSLMFLVRTALQLVPGLREVHRVWEEENKPSFLHKQKLPLYHTCYCSVFGLLLRVNVATAW